VETIVCACVRVVPHQCLSILTPCAVVLYRSRLHPAMLLLPAHPLYPPSGLLSSPSLYLYCCRPRPVPRVCSRRPVIFFVAITPFVPLPTFPRSFDIPLIALLSLSRPQCLTFFPSILMLFAVMRDVPLLALHSLLLPPLSALLPTLYVLCTVRLLQAFCHLAC